MSLLKRYIENIKSQDLFSEKDKLLLAVSGGIDSVVLCELCKQAGYDFAIAHCNFQLRGEESNRDKEFANELAKKYDVAFYVKDFDTKEYATEKKISIQEAARELRYSWFNELLAHNSSLTTYGYILTAHHADDNIETVMMNFFRGTGIKGLKGIEPKQGHIIRSLLFARRKELEAFLNENKLSFVEDSSNLKDDYTRNYFRNQLIPSLEKIFPEVKENMLDNIQRMNEALILYRQAIELQKKKLLEIKGEEIHIPVLKLKKTEPLHSIVYEIIKEFGFSSQQVNEVISLSDSETGKYICSATHRILKNRKWLIISQIESTQSENIVIEEGTQELQFAIGHLKFESIPASDFQPQASTLTAYIDTKEITFPILLRKWKQGDYFYPLGMKKKKKLSRFFIDQKFSKPDKERVWVLETNKKIIWIIGHRIDERFKITGNTKSAMKISLLTT